VLIWTRDVPSEVPIFLQAQRPSQTSSPAPSEFTLPLRPSGVKVLSRKPPPKGQASSSPANERSNTPQRILRPGSEKTDAQPAEEEEDSEAEEERLRAKEFADRQAKAAEERKLKAERYAAARERIFGTGGGGSGSGSGADSTSAVPSQNSSHSNTHSPATNSNHTRGPSSRSTPIKSTDKAARKLWDPNDVNSHKSKQPTNSNNGPTGSIIREPKGPDGTAGFALSAFGGESLTVSRNGRGRGRGRSDGNLTNA
jgi:hypothetical protein